MSVPGGSIGGNQFASQLKKNQIRSGVRDYRVIKTTGKLLAIYDPDTLEESPPPQWVLDRIANEGNRRLWAKVVVEGFESTGERYIPIAIPISVLGDGNSISMVERAKDEFSILIELPGKNIEAARIIGFIPKSPGNVMVGREQVNADTNGPISPMSSSRVFSILGV
jgi:hypothetical protein